MEPSASRRCICWSAGGSPAFIGNGGCADGTRPVCTHPLSTVERGAGGEVFVGALAARRLLSECLQLASIGRICGNFLPLSTVERGAGGEVFVGLLAARRLLSECLRLASICPYLW